MAVHKLGLSMNFRFVVLVVEPVVVSPSLPFRASVLLTFVSVSSAPAKGKGRGAKSSPAPSGGATYASSVTLTLVFVSPVRAKERGRGAKPSHVQSFAVLDLRELALDHVSEA